jgi:hypothetical protein
MLARYAALSHVGLVRKLPGLESYLPGRGDVAGVKEAGQE